MDPNILIPAGMAALATIVVSAINALSKSPIVQTEGRRAADDRDAVIESLSAALLHCLREHGGAK